MKFAQKWIVVPYQNQTKHSDPCPPSKQDQIQKDLTNVLKKKIDVNTKVNEYNQVIAQHQVPMHPIVPHQSDQEQKTPIRTHVRKSLNFEEETPQLNDITIFDTPTGLDPYTNKKTIRKTQTKFINRRKIGNEEKSLKNRSQLKFKKDSNRRNSRLNLIQNNRSLIRYDDKEETDEVQSGSGLITNWKILQ